MSWAFGMAVIGGAPWLARVRAGEGKMAMTGGSCPGMGPVTASEPLKSLEEGWTPPAARPVEGARSARSGVLPDRSFAKSEGPPHRWGGPSIVVTAALSLMRR